jgi:polysaccharide biosynthesis protein PslH
MKILFLTQIIPYPPNAGPRVKTWNVLRYLAGRGHEVTLASFIRPEEEPFLPEVAKVCHTVHTVPIHRSRVADVGYWLKSHLSQRPFLIERDDLKPMRDLVGRLLAAESFDVIHADQLTMTQFALDLKEEMGGKRPFTIFDAHNATWTIWQRMGENAPFFLRPVYRLEENRIKAYEAMLVQRFDHTMVVIEPDRDALLDGAPAYQAASLASRISAIPIAIDTQALRPVSRPHHSSNIITLGSLNYPPNADGIRWFLQEVFPLIQREAPQVTLTVIGKDPPADFMQIATQSQGSIQVTGYVADLTPYMAQSALLVVPVRAGSGMRVRLLEAFARAMPSVTTTMGMEGIAAHHEQELLIGDTPETFAAETLRLLRDPALQEKLGRNGRLLAESRYDWQVALQQMDAVYEQANNR